MNSRVIHAASFASWRRRVFFALAAIAMSLAVVDAARATAADEAAMSKRVCADFLAKLGKKPNVLEFVGCEKTEVGQIKTLRSIYRVAGKDAKSVEAYFVKRAGMPRLARSCCLWESVPKRGGERPHGVLKSGRDVYVVRMGSEENLVSTRARWPEIDYFYVQVDFDLELP